MRVVEQRLRIGESRWKGNRGRQTHDAEKHRNLEPGPTLRGERSGQAGTALSACRKRRAGGSAPSLDHTRDSDAAAYDFASSSTRSRKSAPSQRFDRGQKNVKCTFWPSDRRAVARSATYTPSPVSTASTSSTFFHASTPQCTTKGASIAKRSTLPGAMLRSLLLNLHTSNGQLARP